MKKATRIGLIAGAGLFGTMFLSSCTASFCSTTDKAHCLYSYDPGVTSYSDKQTDTSVPLEITWVEGSQVAKTTISGVYCTYSFDNSPGLTSAISSGNNIGVLTPNKNILDNYYKLLDNNCLVAFLKAKGFTISTLNNVKADDILRCKDSKSNTERMIGEYYGHLKFVANESNPTNYWKGYDAIVKTTRAQVEAELGVDFLPSSDFEKVYKSTMDNYVKNWRTCLATNQGFYGSYGNKKSVLIEGKTYSYGWSKGFFDGLLVWPIGAFIDVLAVSFGANTMTNGVPQILAILLVTFIIRGLMLAATWKSTAGTAKMTELQPEITKIQNKYPNANTNQYEKQRMAEEMQKLYKKNKINPFSTILVLIIQFPVFICVWGALSGSAVLTSGTVLGLRLSDSISSVLFNATNWGPAGNYAAVTAFFLFILMAAAQTVSMLLPQWIQKKKQKEVAKLGNNPAQKSSNNKMKWFTYIMLIVIIFMGFSLVSAMGVYWFVGALFSIAQTLITQAIMKKKDKKKGVIQ